MEKITDQQRLKPWMGFALFAALMVIFMTVCRYMQMHWNLVGLVLTEAVFLSIAICFCLIRKVSIKEVFPVKKPKIRDLFGCLFLLLAGQSFSVIATLIVGILFPSWTSDAYELSSFLYSGNAVISFLIVAVTPAICEEAIHRGAILSCFRSLKDDRLIILIMAILFGINHMSPLRFLATAILGAVLSYVLVKKNNILLTALMHFANNAYSSIIGILGAKASQNSTPAAAFSLSSLGIYLIIGFMAPVFLVLGCMLLNPEKHKKIRFLFAGIASALMLVSGILLFSSSYMKKPICDCEMSYTVTAEDPDTWMEFGVEEERDYSVTVIINCSKTADYRFTMEDASGNLIFDETLDSDLGIKTFTSTAHLPVGSYLTRIYAEDGSLNDHPEIRITVR